MFTTHYDIALNNKNSLQMFYVYHTKNNWGGHK